MVLIKVVIVYLNVRKSMQLMCKLRVIYLHYH